MNNEIKQTEESRRDFILKISLGLGGLAAIAVAIPVAGALLAPLLENEEKDWVTVGTAKDFKPGTVTLVTFQNPDPKAFAGVTANTASWLRRGMNNDFIAFAVNCSHLGCPVRWEENANLFMCPCHGGVYYHDGTVASGPPPRALSQYKVRIFKGSVQIQTGPIPITNLTANRHESNE
jgi:quinol---cytochrome c reductase iron-sulfur subunit, bacillus type